jgi:hypothetical protein
MSRLGFSESEEGDFCSRLLLAPSPMSQGAIDAIDSKVILA